jgi:DNA-binding transcriptional LysR family regulator
MELDVRLLRTFRVVAQTRSFTGAARKLKLTQSAISQQVSALERELKTQLLVRSNRFVGLTTMGEILLQCACQVLDSLDRVRDLLAEQASTNAGRLSVAVPATFCHWLLPHLIDEFHQRFPAIQVCVVMTDVEAAVERLAHREVDLALMPATIQHKSLGMAALGKDELVMVMTSGHPLAKKPRVMAADLKEQRLIMPPAGNLRFLPWDDFLIHSGVFPKVVVETDDLELAKHLAVQDVGITVAPRWSVSSAVERGECVALPIGPSGVYREWYLGYHSGTQLSGARRSFLRVCAEQLPRLFGEGARRRQTASPSPSANGDRGPAAITDAGQT